MQEKKAPASPKIGEYYEQLLEIFEKHPEYFHNPAPKSLPAKTKRNQRASTHVA